MQKTAALRAAVFSLSAKNRKGGVQTPPSRARVNIRMKSETQALSGGIKITH